jgi:cyclopropane fatty-acyl-phospholipid synthase-like methyltransferase
MEQMKFFYELYEGLPRCGPGNIESTQKAYAEITDIGAHAHILDIGCGPGAQTLELAKLSGGNIIALDNHQPFLDKLLTAASEQGLKNHIRVLCQSMLEMSFEDESFDVIWSEGALYFMGFRNGLKKCFSLLKLGGYAAVSEAVYLRSDLPNAVIDFWESEYPDISDIDGKIADITKENFKLCAHFTLPESAWLESYYLPMEEQIAAMHEKYPNNKEAESVLNEAQREIDFCRAYSEYYGYEY